jgi:hypothetical protein
MSDVSEQNQLDAIAVEGLIKASKDFDRILLEAVEAGIESGRSIGVLESYNFLIREGFDGAAEVLMELVHEEEQIRKNRADA